MSSKRDEYLQQLKTKLDEWNAEIDVLEEKAGRLAAEAKQRYDKQIEEAKARRDELQDKLAELTQAGDAAWDDLKSGIDLAWEALSNAVSSAKSKFE